MPGHEVLTLLGTQPTVLARPCIVSGDQTMSWAEVWARAAGPAQAISMQVPPNHRIGLVDTPDPASIARILPSLIAGRSVARACKLAGGHAPRTRCQRAGASGF